MSEENLVRLEDKLSEAASDLSIWTSFLEHAGWKKLLAIAEGQKNLRQISILCTPLPSMDLVLEQEFKKGEYSGISSFCLIPQNAQEEAEQNVASLQEAIKQEESNASTIPTAPRSRVDDDEFHGE